MVDASHDLAPDIMSKAGSSDAVFQNVKNSSAAENGGSKSEKALWTEECSKKYHEHPDEECYDCHESKQDVLKMEEQHPDGYFYSEEVWYYPDQVVQNSDEQNLPEDAECPEYQVENPEHQDGYEDDYYGSADEYFEDSDDWDSWYEWKLKISGGSLKRNL